MWVSPHDPLQRACFVAIDALLTLGCIWGGVSISRTVLGSGAVSTDRIQIGMMIIYTALLLLGCDYFGLYSRRPKAIASQILRVMAAILLAGWCTGMFGYAWDRPHSGPVAVGLVSALNALVLVGWRVLRRYSTNRQVAHSRHSRAALILGAGATGKRLAQHLSLNPGAGFTVLGMLDDGRSGPGILGSTAEFSRLAQTKFVETLFVTLPLDRGAMTNLVREASSHGVKVKLVLDLPLTAGKARDHIFLDKFALLDIYDDPLQEVKLAVKRAIDVAGSAVGLVILSPILGLIAIAVKLDSPGPVVYRSFRVGKQGRKFPFYKFRTMIANADAIKEQLRDLNEREGLLFKITDDPRITRVGRWLRKYSLDELLQLWNVFRGDMSLVGPRPASVDEFDRYRLQHLLRVSVTPGVTGLWQITARNDPSFERYLALDRDYILKWSLGLDLKILLKTAPAVLRGEGR